MSLTVHEASSNTEIPPDPADIPLSDDEPSPRIPFELVLHTSTFLQAQKADHALSNLAATNKLLNDKITPRLYDIVHFHSAKSLRAFLLYFNPGGVALRGEAETVLQCKDKEAYGRRNGYLTGLINHIEIIIPHQEYEQVDATADAIQKKRGKDRYEPMIFPRTAYVELTGTCPHQVHSKTSRCPHGCLRAVVFGTFFAEIGCMASRESTTDHRRTGSRAPTSHCGFWATIVHCGKVHPLPGGPHTVHLHRFVFLLDEKTREYRCECRRTHDDKFFGLPVRGGKKDRPLVMFTTTPASDTSRTDYDDVGMMLRLLQRFRKIRLVMRKTQPFTDGIGFRRWTRDKAQWLKTLPGAWEDWPVGKRRLFNEMIWMEPDDETSVVI